MKLQPGDIFCSKNPMALGRAINAVQAFWARDNSSEYSHAGIILNKQGTTYEALWTVRSQYLREAYGGSKVLIGRHRRMDLKKFARGIKYIAHHTGQFYPFWRLPLHLIPPCARMLSFTDRLVCSELTKKFLVGAVICELPYAGETPDGIADMIKKFDAWDVVFEGEM